MEEIANPAEKQCLQRDVSVMSWRFHNRAWQPWRHDRLSETSGTLWIHWGALTNQRCSLATGCGIRTSRHACCEKMRTGSRVVCEADAGCHLKCCCCLKVHLVFMIFTHSPDNKMSCIMLEEVLKSSNVSVTSMNHTSRPPCGHVH